MNVWFKLQKEDFLNISKRKGEFIVNVIYEDDSRIDCPK